MSSERGKAVLRLAVERSPSHAVIAGTDKDALLEKLFAEREARARERGRAEGLGEAEERAAGALSRAIERLEAEREVARARMAADSVQLATEIARVLVRREIDVGHHDIETIVRETLAASGAGRASCVVHLHPSDAERLKRVPFRAGTQIEADHEIARGDVHVTTPHGVLVRDVDSALASIAERIRGELA